MCVRERGGGVWWIWGSVGKHQGELASERQASWQARGLLITQGLPPPLGAVSNMRGRNQPLKSRSPLQSAADCVCVCIVWLWLWPELTFLCVSSVLNWRKISVDKHIYHVLGSDIIVDYEAFHKHSCEDTTVSWGLYIFFFFLLIKVCACRCVYSGLCLEDYFFIITKRDSCLILWKLGLFIYLVCSIVF